MTSEETKIKEDIRKEYAKTYPNIIFTLTNTLETISKERDTLRAENEDLLDRLNDISAEHVKTVLECKDLKKELSEYIESEKILSDEYMKVRVLLNAFDTNKGGRNRFEVTLNKLADIKAENERLKAVSVEDIEEVIDQVYDCDHNGTGYVSNWSVVAKAIHALITHGKG